MDLRMPAAAVEFAAVVERVVADRGGVDLARRAETDPVAIRRDLWRLLAELGVGDVNVRADLESACAGAELCRVAGALALPLPLMAWLARTRWADQALALVDPAHPLVEHGDEDLDWLLAGVDGTAWRWGAVHMRRPVKLAPFALLVDLVPLRERVPEPDVALVLTLDAWRILGALDRALDLARRHIRERRQFGQRLAAFQAVRFQVADTAVAVRGLHRLCEYTLWRQFPYQPSGLIDALALRSAALDRARSVLATTHQLLGALGFCDEHDLSVIDRHVQGALRIPHDVEATVHHLIRGRVRQGPEVPPTTDLGAAVSKGTALVTGGSGGIGAACSRLLRDRGYVVILTARRPEPLRATAARLGAAHVVADCTEEADVARLAGGIEHLAVLVPRGRRPGAPPRAGATGRGLRPRYGGQPAVGLPANRRVAATHDGRVTTDLRLLDRCPRWNARPHRLRQQQRGAERLRTYGRPEVERDGINVHVLVPAPVDTPMLADASVGMHVLEPDDLADAVGWLAALPPRVVVRESVMRAMTRGPHAGRMVGSST